VERVQAGVGESPRKTADRIIDMVACDEVPADTIKKHFENEKSWNSLIEEMEKLFWEKPPSMAGLEEMVQELLELHRKVEYMVNYWPNRLSRAQTIAENMARKAEDFVENTKEEILAKVRVRIGWTTFYPMPSLEKKSTGESSEQRLRKLKEIVALSRSQLARLSNTSEK
jgi:hypothetical protein